MKRIVFGIVLGFLVGSSLLAWAVGATPFESIKLNNTTATKILKSGTNKVVSDSLFTDDGTRVWLGSDLGVGLLSVDPGSNTAASIIARGLFRLSDGVAGVALTTDGANIFAQRSTTNAQTFRIYETFTDASNYELGAIVMGSDLMTIGPQTLGTGSDNMGINLVTTGTGTVAINGTPIASGGDSITVNASAATDANLLDGDIDWTLDTGTTPDNITATVGCTGCVDITDMASDAVGEPELKAVDAAVDEECLTYETTTGDFEWQACGGAGGKPWEKFTANQAFLPAASYSTQDTRNTHPVLDFDAAADECAYFGGFLASTYAGGGLNVVLAWLATSATTGATGWLVSIEAHPDDALDLDADSFVADNSASATTASATGEVQYTTIAFTDGADMDSLVAGESYRLRVCRDGDGSVVTDDMAGDAELYKVVVYEP